MSDLGNVGRPNSMKLGEDIDLDELLLDTVLFVFVLASFQFFTGVSFWGLIVQKNTRWLVMLSYLFYFIQLVIFSQWHRVDTDAPYIYVYIKM